MKPRLLLLYALRNLRSGLQGFWILLTCLTLGVSAIAIIGSLAASIDRGLAEQGQPLLGGDLEFSMVQHELDAEQLAHVRSLGTVSEVTTLRAMANANGKATLVEIKAVDQAYPLYGSLLLGSDTAAKRVPDDSLSVLVDPLLLGRLGIKPGDSLKLGTAPLRISGIIAAEPDRISDGLVLGPRLMMSHAALKATGLVQPGSLTTHRYRVKLPGETDLKAAKTLIEKAQQKFPKAGWRVRARDGAASGAERFVERLSYFMTLVGVSALVIGGAGIANAISAFVDRQRKSIAILKCLGLENRDVLGLYMTEVFLVGLVGIAIAMLLGAFAPIVLKSLFGHILPLPVATGVNFKPLLFAAALGLLILGSFAMLPLARISRIRGADLFRGFVAGDGGRGWAWGWLGFSLVLLAIAAGLVIANADNHQVTAMYLGGLLGSFALLGGLAFLLIKLVTILPRPRHLLLRQALGALHKPGSASFSVILALGLGLSLFVTLALTDETISRELRAGIPEKAPAFFVLDVRNQELPAFKQKVNAMPGVTSIGNAPMLQGRIVKVKGIDAEKITPKPEVAWALRGDRGLTYAADLPKGSELVSGSWWPSDYAGPPLVSMVDEIADGIGLEIGDKVTVSVLGREIEAEVASLRRVNWRSMGINFVMVFSPNTLRSAPHAHVVTIEMKDGDEAAVVNGIAAEFPSVTVVRVKDALATVSDLLAKMLVAVRSANGLTLLTGVLVLAGALASGLSLRSYESVVLKTYGASRRQLLVAFVLEYGFIGLVSALFGILTGTLGAWYLAEYLLEMPFVFSATTAVVTALLAMLLTVSAGLLVTFRALSAKPAAYLRDP